MIDHEQIVSFMLRLKYSLNIQKPESLTCENIKLPDPKDKTIKFGFAPVCVAKGMSAPGGVGGGGVGGGAGGGVGGGVGGGAVCAVSGCCLGGPGLC